MSQKPQAKIYETLPKEHPTLKTPQGSVGFGNTHIVCRSLDTLVGEKCCTVNAVELASSVKDFWQNILPGDLWRHFLATLIVWRSLETLIGEKCCAVNAVELASDICSLRTGGIPFIPGDICETPLMMITLTMTETKTWHCSLIVKDNWNRKPKH